MADDIKVNVVKLEDNEDYIIFEALENKNNKYLFLVKENNNKDICIRKIVNKDNKEYLVKLDTEQEFEEVMSLFNIKHNEKEVN